MPAKLTQKMAEQRVQNKCIEMNYTCSEFVYINARNTYLPLKCHCGHEWNSTNYFSFVNSGKGCPKCGGTKKLTQEEAERIVQNKCIEMNYTCSEFVYITVDTTYLPLKCHCGHEWNTTNYNKFINQGKGCPKCGGTKKLTQEEAERMVQNKCIEMNYTCSEFVYINADTTYLPLKCHCGHEWNTTNYNMFMRGRGCKKCGTGESKCISRDIDPYFDDFETEKTFDELRSIGILRYDRYVPYLNLLLEYDGIQHIVDTNPWYSEDGVERDRIKTEYAINNGYNFIRIAYYEDHVQALESFLVLVLKHQDKQIVQIYGEVQILDKK